MHLPTFKSCAILRHSSFDLLTPLIKKCNCVTTYNFTLLALTVSACSVQPRVFSLTLTSDNTPKLLFAWSWFELKQPVKTSSKVYKFKKFLRGIEQSSLIAWRWKLGEQMCFAFWRWYEQQCSPRVTAWLFHALSCDIPCHTRWTRRVSLVFFAKL